jgi:hypothetical protein
MAHVDLLKFGHLLQAFEDGDEEKISAIVNGTGDVYNTCKPVEGVVCWEFLHTSFETVEEAEKRTDYYFTGRRLCRCDPPCLSNGEGGRFVPNTDPKVDNYRGWRPISGSGGRTKYDSEERALL